MKPKHLLILLALVIVGVLCSFKYSNREGANIPGEQQMEILYFQGHSYVCYRFYKAKDLYGNAYGYGGASIVHNPDCKCGKGGGR
ncbi:MAG: hypothetical protein HDQ88_01795 [Clostridia bacterium]|nr:hypothetical protein [Clostridia bacterium]